jgi:hypothetical protein
MAKIRFVDKDPRILPEMSAKVGFLSREIPGNRRAPRTAVQSAATVKRGDRDVVFVVRGDRAMAMPVRLGDKIGDLVEVVSGLRPGEKVVLKPPEKLQDGAMVSLQTR